MLGAKYGQQHAVVIHLVLLIERRLIDSSDLMNTASCEEYSADVGVVFEVRYTAVTLLVEIMSDPQQPHSFSIDTCKSNVEQIGFGLRSFDRDLVMEGRAEALLSGRRYRDGQLVHRFSQTPSQYYVRKRRHLVAGPVRRNNQSSSPSSIYSTI